MENNRVKALNYFKTAASVSLAMAAALFLAGCAHTDQDNLSERPWNAPKSWETGIPQQMMQGR